VAAVYDRHFFGAHRAPLQGLPGRDAPASPRNWLTGHRLVATHLRRTVSSPFAHATLELRFRAGWQRAAFLLLTGAASLFLAYHAIRWAYAERLADADTLQPLQRAATLDARNPRIFDKLGRLDLYALGSPPNPGAVDYFRRATELASFEADYWADLASACEWKHDLVCADRSVNQALRLDPMAPRFEWLTANYFIRTERPADALPHLRRLLKLSADYAEPTFDLCAHAFANPDIVLTDVLSKESDPGLKLAFVNYAATHGQMGVAAHVWSGVSAAKLAIPFDRVRPYLQQLLAAGDISEAETVWNDLQRVGSISSQPSDSLIYNGDFAHAPLNGGFDWQSAKLPYVQLDFSDPSGPAGTHCLRVDFTVPRNDDVELAFQLVPVQPRTTYLLSSRVRSVTLTSDSGPRLAVADALCPTCLAAETDGILGTTPWHLLTLRFTTGDKTRLLRLSIRRLRSRSFPPNITGGFWLGDVSLRAETPAGGASKHER